MNDGIKKLENAWMNSWQQQIDMVEKKKQQIAGELKLIPENSYLIRYNYLKQEKQKNLDERSDNEIREKLGKKNPVYLIYGYYKDVDKYLSELIALYQKRLPLENEQNTPSESIIHSTLTLLELFENTSKYNHVMNLLVEKGYCQADTFIWKDAKKGNKGYLAAILKYLHSQQYYKNNLRPTSEQIQSIAKNTFGWEMGIDTIKRSNPEQFDVSFLPAASEIK